MSDRSPTPNFSAPNSSTPTSSRPVIGWIGTGVMGAAMAGRMIDAGYSLVVFNRTASKTEPLVRRGASAAASPREVAGRADIVMSIVGRPEDVREIYLHPDSGVLAGTGALAGSGVLRDGTRCRALADMTTSDPVLALEIGRAAAERGILAVDAPVSGGDIGARSGTLSIMVGGCDEAFVAMRPHFEPIGGTIVHQGGPGSGQHTKMVNQILIAGTMLGLCEAIDYCQAAGLNADAVLESVSGGAAGSWSLSNLASRILRADWEPGFFIDHFLKDLRIALDNAGRMDLKLPAAEMARRFYQIAAAGGLSQKGTQALAKVYSSIAGDSAPLSTDHP